MSDSAAFRRPLDDERVSYPPKDESWRSRANCLGLPVEWWFSAVPSQTSRARWICSWCPIVAPCVSAAIEDGDYGIRGGLTHEERSVLVKRRLPVSHRVAA